MELLYDKCFRLKKREMMNSNNIIVMNKINKFYDDFHVLKKILIFM